MKPLFYLGVLAVTLLAQQPAFGQGTVGSLTSAITATQLTIPVSFTSVLGGSSVVTLESEQILVCSVSGVGINASSPTWSMIITVCAGGRGYNGSTAASHTAGVSVVGNSSVQQPGNVVAKRGAGAFPSFCTAGDLFIRTDQTPGQNLYVCDSNNSFHQGVPGASSADAAPPTITNLTPQDSTWACLATLGAGSTNLSGYLTASSCTGTNSGGGTFGPIYFSLNRAASAGTYAHGAHCNFISVDNPSQDISVTGFTTTGVSASGLASSGGRTTYACTPF